MGFTPLRLGLRRLFIDKPLAGCHKHESLHINWAYACTMTCLRVGYLCKENMHAGGCWRYTPVTRLRVLYTTLYTSSCTGNLHVGQVLLAQVFFYMWQFLSSNRTQLYSAQNIRRKSLRLRSWVGRLFFSSWRRPLPITIVVCHICLGKFHVQVSWACVIGVSLERKSE